MGKHPIKSGIPCTQWGAGIPVIIRVAELLFNLKVENMLQVPNAEIISEAIQCFQCFVIYATLEAYLVDFLTGRADPVLYISGPGEYGNLVNKELLPFMSFTEEYCCK